MQKPSIRVVLWTTLTWSAIVLACLARPTAGEVAVPAAEPAAAKQVKPFRGRLPNYYTHVVDQKQRIAIYQIQAEYAQKLAALKAQLEAMTKERDTKVAAVLSPEQRKKVAQLTAAAKAKRAQKKKPAK